MQTMLNLYRVVGDGQYNTWAIEVTHQDNTIVLGVPKGCCPTQDEAMALLVKSGF